MNLPLFEPTYSVVQLGQEIQSFLGQAFAAIWVAGEVERVKESQRGHLYFELIEKGEGDQIVGKLDAVIWRGDWQRLRAQLARSDQRLAAGQQIRCRVAVDFYPAGGRLQLVVREIDPTFTLGHLARRRAETLAALVAAGSVERNRALPLPAVPREIGLVTSQGSAAYHDFLATLRESGFGFRVRFVHAAMQGREAEREVVSALALLAATPVEVVALVRGGGARTDLAAFDSRAIAEAVATMPVPVLTGLGHEIDQAIADLVAHTAAKTPTKVAELLVALWTDAEALWRERREALVAATAERLTRAAAVLGASEQALRLARLRLAAECQRLDRLAAALDRSARRRLFAAGQRLAPVAPRLARLSAQRLERARRERAVAGWRLVSASQGRVAARAATLAGLERLAASLAPTRTLARGFSITRRADGALVTAPDAVAPGERISTELAAGRLVSRVEER